MSEPNEYQLTEYRCQECRRLLAKEYIIIGRLEIKCSRCKYVNKVNYKSARKLVESRLKKSL